MVAEPPLTWRKEPLRTLLPVPVLRALIGDVGLLTLLGMVVRRVLVLKEPDLRTPPKVLLRCWVEGWFAAALVGFLVVPVLRADSAAPLFLTLPC